MELRQLHYFLAVVDTGGFTTAAAQCHITQSALSQQIGALERELGSPVLNRRPVGLTQAGRALEPRARAAIAAVEDARREVARRRAVPPLTLRVGAIASLTAFDLPAVLLAVRQKHPAITVTIVQDNTDAMITAVRDGTLDVAIVHTSAPEDPLLASHLINEETFSLIGPDLPPVIREGGDLEKRAYVSLRRGSQLRKITDTCLREAGAGDAIAAEVSDLNLLIRLAVAGFGNAIVPSPVAKPHAHSPISRALIPVRTIRVVSRASDPSPAIEHFITCAQAAATG